MNRNSTSTKILFHASTGSLVIGVLTISVTLFGAVLYYFDLNEGWLTWTVYFALLCTAGLWLTRRKSLK